MTKKEKKPKSERFFYGLLEQIKTNKSTFAVFITLRFFVILAMVVSVIRGNYENLFVCTLALALFMIPAFVEKNFGIQLPSTLEIIILLFIFSAEILGEIQSYYTKIPFWDTMLHTMNGFLCAAVGFALVDIFNRNERFTFKLSPFFLAFTAFCFSMTVGVVWEFFECGCDLFLHTDMQKDTIVTQFSSVLLNPEGINVPIAVNNIHDTAINGNSLGINGYLDIGLLDTMKDLFVNFIGAVVFSIIGFFYVKTRGKGKFARRFIPVVKHHFENSDSKTTQANPETENSSDL